MALMDTDDMAIIQLLCLAGVTGSYEIIVNDVKGSDWIATNDVDESDWIGIVNVAHVSC